MKKTERLLRLSIDLLQKQIKDLQIKVERLESSAMAGTLDRYHLLRVKNREELSDQYVLGGMGYLDLSPEKAFRVYNEPDKDFIILDVSTEAHTPYKEIEEAKKIPLEQLDKRIHEITNKTQTIFVISEKGARSILACSLLNRHGIYNLNNISGGYKFWPGFRLSYDQHDFDDFLKEA